MNGGCYLAPTFSNHLRAEMTGYLNAVLPQLLQSLQATGHAASKAFLRENANFHLDQICSFDGHELLEFNKFCIAHLARLRTGRGIVFSSSFSEYSSIGVDVCHTLRTAIESTGRRMATDQRALEMIDLWWWKLSTSTRKRVRLAEREIDKMHFMIGPAILSCEFPSDAFLRDLPGDLVLAPNLFGDCLADYALKRGSMITHYWRSEQIVELAATVAAAVGFEPTNAVFVGASSVDSSDQLPVKGDPFPDIYSEMLFAICGAGTMNDEEDGPT